VYKEFTFFEEIQEQIEKTNPKGKQSGGKQQQTASWSRPNKR